MVTGLEPLGRAEGMKGLRFRLGVWLLKPHWLPLLENYNRMQLPAHNPHGPTERDHCTYIVIGIKKAIGVGRPWSRY